MNDHTADQHSESELSSFKTSLTSNQRTHFALKIVSVFGNGSNVPLLGHDLLMSRSVITDQDENLHHNVLSDTDDVRSGHLSDGNLAFIGSVQIDMVRTDTCGLTQLQVFGFGDNFARQVSRVERRGD